MYHQYVYFSNNQCTPPRIKLVRNNRRRFCQVQCSNELLLDIREELGPLVAGQHIDDDRSSYSTQPQPKPQLLLAGA